MLDYNEGEQAAEHADTTAADAEEEQKPAVESAAAGGDAQMEVRQGRNCSMLVNLNRSQATSFSCRTSKLMVQSLARWTP